MPEGAKLFSSARQLAEQLRAAQYVIDSVTLEIVYLATRMHKPLLIEGPPGCGKTELAYAMSFAANAAIERLQCYVGITEEKSSGDSMRGYKGCFFETQVQQFDQRWDELRSRLHALEFF